MTENDVKWKSKLFLYAKPGHDKVLTLQKPVRILNKKIQNIKITKFHEIWMNYYRVRKQNIPGGND